MIRQPDQSLLNSLRALAGQPPATRAILHVTICDQTSFLGEDDDPTTPWSCMIRFDDVRTPDVERLFATPGQAVDWADKWMTDRGLKSAVWENWGFRR